MVFTTRYQNDILWSVGLEVAPKKEVSCNQNGWIQTVCLSKINPCDERSLCGWICYLAIIVIILDAVLLFPMSVFMGGEEYELVLAQKLNVTKNDIGDADFPDTQIFLNALSAETGTKYMMVVGLVLFVIQDRVWLLFNSCLKSYSKIHPERGCCVEAVFFIIGVIFDVLQLLGIFFSSSETLLYFVIVWPVRNFLRLLDIFVVLVFRSEECACTYRNYSFCCCIIDGFGADAGYEMEGDSLPQKLCRLVVETLDLGFSLVYMFNTFGFAIPNAVYLIACVLKFISIGLNITVSLRSYVQINGTDVDRSVNGDFACTTDILEGLEEQEKTVRQAWRRSTFRFAIPLAVLTVISLVLVLLRSVFILPTEIPYMPLCVPYGIGVFAYALVILCNLQGGMDLRDMEFVLELGVGSSLADAKKGLSSDAYVQSRVASLSAGLPQTWAEAQIRSGITPSPEAVARAQALADAQARQTVLAKAADLRGRAEPKADALLWAARMSGGESDRGQAPAQSKANALLLAATLSGRESDRAQAPAQEQAQTLRYAETVKAQGEGQRPEETQTQEPIQGDKSNGSSSVWPTDDEGTTGTGTAMNVANEYVSSGYDY